MKCVKCGAELKPGCVYCSVCGHEAQIVSDYSVLEDDYLRSLLREEDRKKEDAGKKGRSRKSTAEGKAKAPEKKSAGGRIALIVTICILTVVLIAGTAVKLSIDYRNANSYDYQVQMAEEKFADQDYKAALNYYKTALSLKTQDISVRMAMADLYLLQGDDDSAMVLLIEVIGLDGGRREAYEKVISVYEKKEDYESIIELSSGVKDDELSELFEPYIVEAPIISPAEGEYDDYITVSMFSLKDFDIYYTINGVAPDREKGRLYSHNLKIPLKEAGDYEIQAVCRNEKGIYSEVAVSNYVVTIAPPDYPNVQPDGGRISEEAVPVVITAGENCDIYYTWDGTDPTKFSEKYTRPLEIPEGNNILSVLAIDRRTGLDSGVYRTNFIYYP